MTVAYCRGLWPFVIGGRHPPHSVVEGKPLLGDPKPMTASHLQSLAFDLHPGILFTQYAILRFL